MSRPMNDPEINAYKRPSEELIRMIENFGPSCKDLGKSVRKITQKGYEEGFGDLEIVLLARKILRPSLSRRKLNYWFPIKKKWKSMVTEESSSHYSQNVNNNVKNDIDKSKAELASQTRADSVVPLLKFKDRSAGETEDEATNNSNSIRIPVKEPRGKTSGPKTVSYFDLTDPNLIDCTNHPMYQRACKRIEELKVVDKKASSPGEGKILENRAITHDAISNQHVGNGDYFCISKVCDFVTEHFKPQIQLADAIEYLKQLHGLCRKIDLGFRVAE